MEERVQKGPDEKYCSECAAVINVRAEICPRCGVRQFAPPPAIVPGIDVPERRNKLVAALLAIFLGGIGIHKFYLGRTGWGIAYLLCFWTFIPALVGIIEGILYLVMSEAEFARKYGDR